MKKLLLFTLGIAPCLLFAQNHKLSKQNQKASALMTASKVRKVNLNAVPNTEQSQAPVNMAKGTQSTNKATGSVGSVIGYTFYDLQTNASTQRRITNLTGNKKSATFTISPDSTDANFPGRGTGYNHFNGTTWGAQPNVRLEANTRTGWPSLCDVNGHDLIDAHKSPAPYNVWQMKNATYGGAITSEVNATPANTTNIWPKTANSGNNIYLIDCNQDTGFVASNGVKNAVAYSRSTDGGLTYVQDHIFLPGYNSTRYYRSGGDDYFIDAKDSIVAVVIGGSGKDITLWKSTDYGVTFTMTIVDSFPIPAYTGVGMTDVNGDGLTDTLDTNDGTVSCLIDNAGMVHIWWGFSSMFNDGTGSFLRFVGALVYWNEYLPAQKLFLDGIGNHDCDGDGSFGLGTGYSIAGANSMDAVYRSSGLINTPQAGIDASGNLFVVYSAVMDNDTSFGLGVNNTPTPSGQNYRDLFVTYCPGTSVNYQDWGFPVNITHSWGYEDMYPSIARNVDNKLHITWQEDMEAGNNLTDGDPVAKNYIKYAAIDKAALIANTASADSMCNPTAAPQVPVANYSWAYTPNDSCRIQFTDLSLGNPTAWEWKFTGTAVQSTLQNPVYVFGTKANFTPKLLVSNIAGSSLKQNITIAACGKATGIIDINNNVNIDIYPNPSNGLVNLSFTSFNASQATIIVSNVAGQTINKVENVNISNNTNVSLDLSNQATGIYFIRIVSNKGTYTERIVLEK